MKGDMHGADLRNHRNDSEENRTTEPAVEGTQDRSEQKADTAQPSPSSAGPAAGGTSAPPDPTKQSAAPRANWFKVLGGLGLGCLAIGVVGLLLTVGSATLFLSSCMASCSDRPIGDSRENAAFIANRTATERDLVVFDALYGSLDALHERMVQRGEEKGAGLLPTDELRAQVAAGTWPADGGNALSPQVWVRIAELSQTWLEEQTGERWQVEDFIYPFPGTSAVPVPAIRDEDDYCGTRLRCIEGEDKGLYAGVKYYRWAKEAYFEAEDLADVRATAQKRANLYERIRETGLVGDRACLLSEQTLYIWAAGADDALRDAQALLQVANELKDMLGDYGSVILLEHDTPVLLGYEELSTAYPNSKPAEELSFDEAHETLLSAGRIRYLDHAKGDELLCVHWLDADEPVGEERVTGTLAAESQQGWRHGWRAPSDGSSFDEDLVTVVAQACGIEDERLLVASLASDDGMYDSLQVWLVTPRGTFPETPAAFCASMDTLRDALWAQVPELEGRIKSLYVHVFEIDEQTLVDKDGKSCTFEQLRAAAQADPTALEAYTPSLLLTIMIYDTQRSDDEGPRRDSCRPQDVEGSIARSRAWYQELEGTNETK